MSRLPACILTLILAATALCCCSPKLRDAATLHRFSGTWQGDGEIVSKGIERTRLHFQLVIAPDGGVSGSVGDASLRDGHLHHNRSLTAVFFRLGYKLLTHLDGPLIEAEGVNRDRLEMHLRFTKGDLVCAAFARDEGADDRQTIWIYRIYLRRCPTAISP